MEKEQLQQELNGIKSTLEQSVEKVKSDLEKSIRELKEVSEKGSPDKVKEVVAEQTKTINEALKEIQDWKKERQEIDPLNQNAIDKMLSELKAINTNTSKKGKKSFEEAFCEALENDFGKIQEVRKGHSHIIELKGISLSQKSVGNMTLAGHLTGDSVMSYSPMQAWLPSAPVNFRDLMRTVYSDTGTYVHYKETAGEGSIGQQTEGSSKSQIDFDLTEVKTVNKYYSGFTRFSKQLSKSLPFFQGTLPTILLRSFFLEENDQFKSVVAAAASGDTTTAETDDVKQIIDYIANLRQARYNPTYALVNHTKKAAIDKLTYVNGYYQGSGGVLSNATQGTDRISNVPLIAVDWMNSDKVLIVDNTYLERVECESLRVEFFEQDGDNVTKNLITARIECFEEVNPMLGSAMIFGNL
jgi:hypothetical protein